MHFKYKSALAITAASLVAISLAGCSSDSSGSGDSATPTIAYVSGATGITFYEMMDDEGGKTAKELGAKWVYQGASEWSPTQQTPVVDGVCTNTPDVLIVTPTDGKAMAAALQRCSDNGVKIIAVDTLADESTKLETSITADNEQGGAIAGEYMAEQVGKTGKVVVIGGPSTTTTNISREQGFVKTIKKSYPQMQVLQTQWTESQDPAKAQGTVSDLLVANPDLKGVFCIVENVAEGCAAAVAMSGLDVKVIGYDASESLLANLSTGKIDALVVQPARDEIKAAVEAAMKVIKGKSVEPKIKLNNVLITTATMDDPKFARLLK